jgi:hypothetical protein
MRYDVIHDRVFDDSFKDNVKALFVFYWGKQHAKGDRIT